ncbi:major facilitator superfamily domain-containing protein, partial [Phascolomyces articulosus]
YGTPYLLSFEISKELTALVWIIGPLSGLIMQPIIGSVSDRCNSSMGRRRPFIIGGGTIVCLSMLGIAYAKDIGAWLIGFSGRANIPENIAEEVRRAATVVVIFSFYMLDFSLNAVQASCRALILDIPPLWQQQHANAWAARLSNVAMVIGYFTGFVNLVKLFPFLGDTQMKVFCLVAIFVFIVTVGMTCMMVEEKPISIDEQRNDNNSHWYYTFVHIWHALRTLSKPVQALCNVQFFAWLGWFPFLFYSTTWVSDLYFDTHPRENPESWAKGTRAGSFALLLYAIVSVISGIVLPWLVARKLCCGSFFTMKNVFTAGNLLFAICMLSTIFVSNVPVATLIVAIIGISWSVVLWIPFALVGEYITGTTLPSTPPPSIPTADAPDIITTSSINNDSNTDGLDAGMVLGVHNIYIVCPQFLVAFIAALIFRLINWVENDRHQDDKEPDQANVAWVLVFGGVMSLIATVLCRYIVEVPSVDSNDKYSNRKSTTLAQIPTTVSV